MVPVGEDTQEATREAQQLPQNNNDHDSENRDNDHEEEEEEDNEDEDKDDVDYTPLGYFEKEKMYHDIDEIKTSRNEAPIPIDRLKDLLNRIDITTTLELRIKRVSCLVREEYKAIIEILNGPNVIGRHRGLAFEATYQDVVADAAWHAITTYNYTHHDKHKNSIYHMLSPRKKNKFKTSGVKADVPRMLMVNHQDVSVEMSIRLQVSQ
jgi:hypothetical protein